MVKVTTQEFNAWRGTNGRLNEDLGHLEDSSYALSGIIMGAINLFGAKKEVLKIGEEVSEEIVDVAGAWVLKYLKLKLKERLISKVADTASGSIKTGRSKEEIRQDIYRTLSTLNTAWDQEFDDCTEVVNGVATVVGIKVTQVQLKTWDLTLKEARADLQLCDDFNLTDFKEDLKDGLLGIPETIAVRVEQYIFNGFKNFADAEKIKVEAATKTLDTLLEYINKDFPDCKDTPPKKEEKIKPPPTKKDDPDYIEILLPPAVSTVEETPTGDCCTDLVSSINRLQNMRDWFNEVIRWIRDTRIELKEARQDLKKVFAWLRDTRTELKEARQDAKKILANQDLILSALYDLQIDTAVNSEEIIKTRDLVALNGEMMTIGLGGIATLLGGISAALSATLAAIVAEINEAQETIMGGFGTITKAIAGLETSLAAGFLKMQAELLRMMVQIGKSFIRVEELVNPYLTGEVKSYDWVEMTKEEKAEQERLDKEAKEKAEQEKQSLIDQNLVDPGSAIVVASTAITVTKAVALTALKLNPRAIVYAGYGILGVLDLLQKTVSIVNDLQGDVKEPSALAFTKIEVPVVKWFPELYDLKNGQRDYSKLAKAKDKQGKDLGNFYQPPDYQASTPYIALQEVQVPVGMEQYYIDEYNQAIDEFFYSRDENIILMPDGWEQRPMKYRPQLQFLYVELKENGEYNRSLGYPLNVQHYDFERLGKPTECPLPDYQKGRIYGIMELTDGAKDVVFGKNKEEVLKVMRAIKAITNPAFTDGISLESVDKNTLKWGERDTAPNGSPIKQVNVSVIWCDYYSKGKINRTYAIQKDWRVYFDRVML